MTGALNEQQDFTMQTEDDNSYTVHLELMVPSSKDTFGSGEVD